MNKYFLSLLFCFLFNQFCIAQSGGSLDFSFEPGTGANGEVYDISLHEDYKMIISGEFSTYNGISTNALARINADGSLDTTFNIGTGIMLGGANTGIVDNQSTQSNGQLIVAGHFYYYNGTEIRSIARINMDGSLDTTFNPGTGPAGQIVTTSIQSDGKIIIGGTFGAFNNTIRECIARLNTNGSLDTTFNMGTGTGNSAQRYVWESSIQSDDKIIIAGRFVTYNGQARNKIARLNSDGSLDSTFNPVLGADDDVLSLGIQDDGKILIGGWFRNYNGVARNHIARLNNDGSLDLTFNPGTGADTTVWSIGVQSDGKIMIGGEFTDYNGTQINHIARLNEDGSLDNSFDPGLGLNRTGIGDLDIRDFAFQPDRKIIIGGNFTTYDGTGRNNIARLNGGTVGIEDFEEKEISIYPNPAPTEITVNGYSPAYIKLFNTLGQAVAEVSKGNKLYVGNLSQGLYVLQLFDENGQQVKIEKIIVAK